MRSAICQPNNFSKPNLTIKSNRTQKYLNITLNFCQRSTIHGLNQLAFPKSVQQRYFWMVICLSASIGMVINNYYLIEKFLERPVLTNVFQDHTAFVYPHVSFCFTNPIYFPPEGSPYNRFIMNQYKEYIKFKKLPSTFLTDKIKFADYLYMTRNNTYTHPQWSVLIDCRYQDIQCSYKDLILRHLYAYGACYTFDYSRFESNSSTKYRYGNKELDFIIYKAVDIPIFNFGDPFESVLMPSGILLMIHDRNTFPKLHESYILDEYSQVNLKVINKHHLNIGKKCRSVKSQFSYFDIFLKSNITVYGKYSDCVYQRVQDAVAKYCQCQWQEMQVLSHYYNLPFCSDPTFLRTLEDSCLFTAYSELSNGSLEYCYLDDCEHTTYETVISQSHFPALLDRKTNVQWMKHLVEIETREMEFYGISDLKRKALKWNIIKTNNLNINTIDDAFKIGRYDLMDLEFVERNFMMVKIVPTSFFMDMIEETEGYPLSRLLSDIGGSVGLWLGASLITVFEVFDLFSDLMETYFMIKQKENRIKLFVKNLETKHESTSESLVKTCDGKSDFQESIL